MPKMWNSHTKYHPRIGYTAMPSIKWRVQTDTGGYLVRTNAAGFRSDREFVQPRTPGKFRAILFGDSQTAGDGNSNSDRYSDVLEKCVPNLDVFNYGLSGTGTDQQYLTYLDCADVEHDLLIIGLHVENIGRVTKRFQVFRGASGKQVIYAKPYYTMERGELVLNHVPVPKALLAADALSAEDAPHVNAGRPYAGLRRLAAKLGMRDLLRKVARPRPVPEYDSRSNASWLLLRNILATWIGGSKVPVLLFLVPMWQFVEEASDPANYLARFRELADDTGCYLHDPLPDLWKYTPDERRAFRFRNDSHLSPKGHKAMAISLSSAVDRIMASSPTLERLCCRD